jgi:hypothetical protein
MKVYRAMIWPADRRDEPGLRVTVSAESLDEARSKLEALHGQGTVFDLPAEDDATRPR